MKTHLSKVDTLVVKAGTSTACLIEQYPEDYCCVYAVLFGNSVKFGKSTDFKKRVIAYSDVLFTSRGGIILSVVVNKKHIDALEKQLLKVARKFLVPAHGYECFYTDGFITSLSVFECGIGCRPDRYVDVPKSKQLLDEKLIDVLDRLGVDDHYISRQEAIKYLTVFAGYNTTILLHTFPDIIVEGKDIEFLPVRGIPERKIGNSLLQKHIDNAISELEKRRNKP